MRLFRTFWATVKAAFRRRRVTKEAISLQGDIRRFSKEIESADKSCRRNLRELNKRKRELDEAIERVSETEARLSGTIEEAKKVHKKYKERLDSAQSKLKIMEEVTLPTLLQQNEKIIEMWKAETSVYIMRQVATNQSQEDGDGY